MGSVTFVPTPNPYRTGLNSKDLPPRPLWHYPLAVAIAVFLLYAFVVSLFWFSQRDIVFMTRIVPTRPEAPAGTTRVLVPTFDGEMLMGFWKPPTPGMPVVVSFHGHGSHYAPAVRFANFAWGREGWGVLAVAFRGYPGSTGAPSSDGLMEDGEAARSLVARLAPRSRMLFHGHGIGTAVATRMAELHDAHGLYLEGGLSSLKDLASHHFPWLPTFLMRDGLWAEASIAHVEAPVLLVHGTADWVFPPSFSERLAKASGGRLIRVKDADNATVLGSRDDAAIAFFRPDPQGKALAGRTP